MSNTLFTSIVNLFKNFTEPQGKLLQQIVEPLAKIDESLAEDSMAFIVNGEHVDVLMRLQQLPDDKAGLILGKPGTFGYYWGQVTLTKAEEALAKSSSRARKTLYEKIFDTLSNEQIIRLGKWMAAATQQRNLDQICPSLPEWFHYFAIDGLVTSLANRSFSEKDQRKTLLQHWSIAKLEALLAEEDSTLVPHLLDFIFERRSSRSYYNDDLEVIYKLADCKEYIQTHLTQLQQAAPNYGVEGQENVLQYLQTNKDLLVQSAEVMVQLSICSSKRTRDTATSMLSLLPETETQHYLAHYLSSGNSKQRSNAADLLARLSPSSVNILEQAHAAEKLKSVQQIIMSALQRLKSVDAASGQEELHIPACTPLMTTTIPESFSETVAQNYQQVLEKSRESAEREIEENKLEKSGYKSTWAQRNYKDLQKVKPESLARVVSYLNGEQGLKSFDSDFKIITYQNSLKNLEQFNLNYAVRLFALNGRHYINWDSLFALINHEELAQLELRHIEQALANNNFTNSKRMIAEGMLMEAWNDLNDYIQDADKIWPFFAENMDFLTEAMGLAPSKSDNKYRELEPASAINVLNTFPVLPQQFVPRLLELALGENKRLRFDAQRALERLTGIHLRAIEALDSGKQEIRITAIEWLARLQVQDAIKPLNALLKKEKKEIVRAALLTALEQLGQDISAHLAPKVLLKEAEQGLKGRLSASFTWFDLNALPACTWQDGKAVNPEIIQWWLILAEKLKDPKPNALLQRYMQLLSEKSQQQLANHVLQSFIHQDTRGPSLEEATEIAVKEGPGRLSNYQDWYKRYPQYYAEYANVTLEQVVDELKRQHLATYLGSAIKSKGMLALTFAAQGSTAVKQLQDYMKQHYQRRAQIEAMIHALSISNDPLVIQLLLSLSRRYRTASVQTLAGELVAEIAERNHWSSDELADRTIPTAGLDDQGILQLEYGSRHFTAYVDDKDKFVLKNEDGKVVKALPAARQNDDAALIKEAKALLSNSKKELKQVIDLQTLRLYESMCGERQWSVADWQEYLFAHPIMNRLIQRLVWLEIAADGTAQHFRPSDDGSLLNLDDDEIELASDSHIQISHAVLVGAEQAEQWSDHFKDYKVKPLFEQMNRSLPTFNNPKTDVIEDRKGWLTDTFTLRGVVNKMGYQRTSIEDAGSFDSYSKAFKSLNLEVQIGFSGSYVPEENIPAVLYDLRFARPGQSYWNRTDILIEDVPKILLAECYADYLKLADACSGFDPEWQKKTPW
ncbi:DUF4132 domain-containing protein [Acinetobacter rudis]|uniref:DUF4132 domain-containing protein n=1 Tax=Acinetobacter rudis TaxID=632955 RepID=UPI00280E9E2F|nr:DUF4132 domain-containing protein [Acinetobacter rudis]MDQ8953926.1 DUF4132 domain-containing protein [Acinetobacter rudis]